MSASVLVLYDAHGPQIEALATAVADGARRVQDAEVTTKHIDDADQKDLLASDAIILGSPNWSGVTGFMKSWLDNQGDLWMEGSLRDKVGAAFTTGKGRHSGLEITLLGLIHWMLACGMVVVGLPWSDTMRVSGSYYGATVAGDVNESDKAQARDLGQRVAETALRFRGLPD